MKKCRIFGCIFIALAVCLMTVSGAEESTPYQPEGGAAQIVSDLGSNAGETSGEGGVSNSGTQEDEQEDEQEQPADRDPESGGMHFDADSIKNFFNWLRSLFQSNTDLEGKQVTQVQQVSIAPGTTSEISTEQQFRDFITYINHGGSSVGVTWKLAKDLSFEKTLTIAGIGTAGHPFCATFDGNGKTLSSYTVSGTGAQGLFAYTNGATIQNLSVADVHVSGGSYGGALVGDAKDTIITGCTVSGTVSGTLRVGGIAGTTTGTTITGCENNCDLTITAGGSGDHLYVVGGIAGYLENGQVTDCINKKNISPIGCAGGIVGKMTGTSSAITRCTNSANIQAANYAAGIVATFEGGSVTDCSNSGNINGTSCIGGIAGVLRDSTGTPTVTGCTNSGKISANNKAGGIVGAIAQDRVTLSHCYNLGAMTGESLIGGIVGDIDVNATNTKISNCYNAADVTGGAPISASTGMEKTMLDSCVYNEQLSGAENAKFGLPLTEDELKSGWRLLDGKRVYWTTVTGECYWNFDVKNYPTLLKTPVYTPETVTFALPENQIYDGRALTVGIQETDDIRVGVGAGTMSETVLERENGSVWETVASAKSVGTYRVTVTVGYGMWTSVSMAIKPYALRESDFTVVLPEGILLCNAEHTGYPVPGCASGLLTAGDYEWTYLDADGPTTVASPAKLRITGKGNCAGTLDYDFQLGMSLKNKNEAGEIVFVPLKSGIYVLGDEKSTLMVKGDPTVYQGGVGVYLEQGKTYCFREKENEGRRAV